MPAPGRDQAFLLFTDLLKAGPYLAGIAARGFRSLVITAPPQRPHDRVAISFVGTPGHPLSTVEEFAFVPTHDVAAMLRQVRAWARRFDIVGVFGSSEPLVEPAGMVADLIGVPGVGLRASRVCRNKQLQRLYLSAWSPRSVPAGADSGEVVLREMDGRFPVIVKPLDMFCSIGVRVLDDEAALTEHLAGLDPEACVLVEEYVPGREFSVESIIVDGRPVFTGVTQKATSEDRGDFFVEMAHTVPAANVTEAEDTALKDTQAAIIERLDFGTGMAHGEYRITPEGQVVLMEIAARPAGDGILHLYHLATGRSAESAVIDAALGLPVDYPEPLRWARQVYFEHQPGTLQDVTCDLGEPLWLADHGLWPTMDPVAPEDSAGLRRLLVQKSRGDELRPITDSLGRAVTALFDSPTADGLDEIETHLRKDVNIATT